MSLRRYLITMAITTLICWAAFFTVLLRIDPNVSGTIGFVLFYVALFFALWGTLGLMGFFVRYFWHRQSVPFSHIGISLRQSFWFALIVVLSLILVAEELFELWTGGLLILGFTLLEGFFLIHAHSVQRRYQSRHANLYHHSA